jgi:hypothetical protein
MKKIIFFFLLFLPGVSGVAVTPTSLDFGSLARGEEVYRELLVVNNENFPIEYKMSGFYSEEFILFDGESSLVNVKLRIVDQEDGDYTEYLRVEEVYGSNLVNAISVKANYRVSGGDYSSDSLNLEGVEVAKGVPWILGIGVIGLLGIGAFGYMRKFK